MLHGIVFQVAAGIGTGASCGHAQYVFSEQYINMSIIGPNSLSHETKGHLINLWPKRPVPCSVNCLLLLTLNKKRREKK